MQSFNLNDFLVFKLSKYKMKKHQIKNSISGRPI